MSLSYPVYSRVVHCQERNEYYVVAVFQDGTEQIYVYSDPACSELKDTLPNLNSIKHLTKRRIQIEKAWVNRKIRTAIAHRSESSGE